MSLFKNTIKIVFYAFTLIFLLFLFIFIFIIFIIIYSQKKNHVSDANHSKVGPINEKESRVSQCLSHSNDDPTQSLFLFLYLCKIMIS